MRTLLLQPLLERLVSIIPRIRGYGRWPIIFLPRSGSIKTGPPTFKCGQRIASLQKSDSISITRGVPQTIAAVYCRSVKGCLRLHHNFFGSARRRVRAGVNSSDIGLAVSLLLVSFLDASATMTTFRLPKLQRFSGLDCWSNFKMMSRRANRCSDGHGS